MIQITKFCKLASLSKHVTSTHKLARNHLVFIATATVIHLIIVYGFIIAFIPFGLAIVIIVIVSECIAYIIDE